MEPINALLSKMRFFLVLLYLNYKIKSLYALWQEKEAS